MTATRTEHKHETHDFVWTPNAIRTRLDMTAGSLACGPHIWKDVSYTVDFTKKGVGGLQSNYSLAATTWYDVYSMTDGSGNGLEFMAIPNSGTFERPKGFAYHHLRGSFLTDATPQFYRFYHFGGWWSWNENTGVAPFRFVLPIVGAVWTPVSLAGAICPHAHQYFAGVYATSVVGGASFTYVRPTGSNIVASGPMATLGFSARGAAQPETNRFIDRCDAAQSIEHQDVNVGEHVMDILGYYDPHAV